MRMSKESFRVFRDVLNRHTGNILSDDKEYLVRSRLAPLATQLGLPDLDALAARMHGPASNEAVGGLIDRMTTHETSFFRDVAPFERLASTILPELLPRLGMDKTLRIWSAACSTGQEPYSLAITLSSFFRSHPGYRYEITATDVSQQSIELAKRGIYTDFEARRGIGETDLQRYMEPHGDGSWRVRNEIRQHIAFRTDNLLSPAVPANRFDIIFCRNVLIYFDRDAKRQILERLPRYFRNGDGYLVLGAAESTLGITDLYQRPAGLAFGVFTLAQPGTAGSTVRPAAPSRMPLASGG